MQVCIRPSEHRDLPELRELLALAIRSVYPQWYSPAQTEELLEKQMRTLKRTHASLLVAEVDQQAVGFAALSRWTNSIDAVYVHPVWMRRGIGQQLVIALETLATKQRQSKLHVIAEVNASGFYQAQGYQVTGEFPYALEKEASVPCHMLQKALPGAGQLSALRAIVTAILLLLLGGLGYSYIEKQVLQRSQPTISTPMVGQ